jgi:hypothetical protein
MKGGFCLRQRGTFLFVRRFFALQGEKTTHRRQSGV